MAAGRVSCQLPAPGAQLRWPTTGNWPRRPIQHRGVPGWPRRSNMAEAITVSAPISGTDKTLSFETGKLAFRSEEHTSELQSLIRISYAVFCFNKKHKENTINLIV